MAAWGADAEVANLLVTTGSASGLALEIVHGREDPVLGFAPASRKKPIPALDCRLTADGRATWAWALTPYRGPRPEVHLVSEDTNEGSMVTVTHAAGSDRVYVAPRGKTHTINLAGHKLQGRVAVVRNNKAR